ncbi:MAG: fumarylacetoacetate hydrolase [Aeromicrobium sp.]|nr:fumarylacetoacetate hydrolase [Aeromicrobium sp.]
MTAIVRYEDRGSPRIGVVSGERLWPLPVPTLGAVLQWPLVELRALVETTARGPSEDWDASWLLAPIDGLTEVWASGVTYARSRDARREESVVKDVYELVYDAERPELFFKTVAWRVLTEGERLNVRADSVLNVPEPELVLMVNAHAEIVGYAVGNDMSSRSIEGENPLYLPQAKIYDGSFAVSSAIRPAWELDGAGSLDLSIAMEIRRGAETVWRGSTTTQQLVRPLEELVEHLFRCYSLPQGAMLSTGTGIVPELDFSTRPGDEVHISISEVGTLTNPIGSTGSPVAVARSTTNYERTR